MSSLPSSFPEGLKAPMDISYIQASTSGALLGVLLHITILQRFEIENFLLEFLSLWSSTTVAIAAAFLANGTHVIESSKRVVVFNTSFYIALFSSITIYRVLYHRLARFPGPLGAKISRFYTASLAYKRIQYYKEVDQLHHKYGDFVRTGT